MNKKIFKNEFLRQQWLLYFITIISLLITCSIRIVGYNILKRDSIDYGYTMHTQGYGLLLTLSLLSVLLIPIIMFGYMHSKEKLDLFHSLPITRTNLFLNKYLIGLSYFTISYFITVLVMFTIDKVYLPELTSVSFGYFLFLIKNWLFFVLVYTVFALANTIMGITSYAVFCGILLFWAPFILYDTYIVLYDSLNVALNTPSLTAYFFTNYFGDIFSKDLMDTSKYLIYILSMTVLTVLILILAIYIYNKRDSEKSRTSVAVSKFEIPLKTLILYIVFVTTLFIVISWEDLSILNAIIILLVVILITVSIVEVIFNRSIKNINFKNLLHPTLSAICILIIVFITIKIDIFDTKHYAPLEDSVKYIQITYRSPDYDRETESMLVVNKDEIQKFYELTDKLADVSDDDYYYTDNPLFEFDVDYISDDSTYARSFYLEDEELVNEVLNIPDGKYDYKLTVANDLLSNYDTSVYFKKSYYIFDNDDYSYSISFNNIKNLKLDDRYPYMNSVYDPSELEEEISKGAQLVTALGTDISNILINNPSPQKYIPLTRYSVYATLPQAFLYDSYLDLDNLYLTHEYVETLKFFETNQIEINEQSYWVYKITDKEMLDTLNDLIAMADTHYDINSEYRYELVYEYIEENMELVDTFTNFDKEKTLCYTLFDEELDDLDDCVILEEDNYILLSAPVSDLYQFPCKIVKKVK